MDTNPIQTSQNSLQPQNEGGSQETKLTQKPAPKKSLNGG